MLFLKFFSRINNYLFNKSLKMKDSSADTFGMTNQRHFERNEVT